PRPRRPFGEEAGADPGRLRIGMLNAAPQGEIHSDCVAAVEDAGHLLESLHHTVESSAPATLSDNDALRGFTVIVASSTAYALDVASEKIGREIGEHEVEPGTWVLATMGRTMSAADYIAAQSLNNRLARGLAGWWEDGFDLLLTPTCAAPPPALGCFDATPENPMQGMMASLPYTVFTSPFNVSGQPAISLPLHWNDDGLPIGIQLVAAYGREDLLIRVAAQLEQAEPWKHRRPPLHA
ncbi:MAG: amidase family protein, partial [Myxococcota bacterium]